MKVNAGDLIEITWTHPRLGSGSFYPKSNEDGTMDLGGFGGADEANDVDGAGRNIRKINRKKWFVDIPITWDPNNKNELDVVNELAGDPEETEFTVSHISGVVWGATGAPVGDVQGNTNAGTIPLKISGGGKLKKIVG